MFLYFLPESNLLLVFLDFSVCLEKARLSGASGGQCCLLSETWPFARRQYIFCVAGLGLKVMGGLAVPRKPSKTKSAAGFLSVWDEFCFWSWLWLWISWGIKTHVRKEVALKTLCFSFNGSYQVNCSIREAGSQQEQADQWPLCFPRHLLFALTMLRVPGYEKVTCELHGVLLCARAARAAWVLENAGWAEARCLWERQPGLRSKEPPAPCCSIRLPDWFCNSIWMPRRRCKTGGRGYFCPWGSVCLLALGVVGWITRLCLLIASQGSASTSGRFGWSPEILWDKV